MFLEQQLARFFLAFFIGIMLLSHVDTLLDPTTSFETVLETDLDWDKESKDSQEDAEEDIDKIVFLYEFGLPLKAWVTEIHAQSDCRSMVSFEVILPPPEYAS